MPSETSTDSTRRLVLVAGAGRSGTSTVAGILQRLGLVVPQPEVLTDETNPKGFSESQWVVDYHDDLLEVSNVQVSDARPAAWARTSKFAELPGARGKLTNWLEEQLVGSDRVLIKDPRISWFLSLWSTVAEQMQVKPAFVTMLRPPPEVIGSKRTYYNDLLQDAQGTAAWVNMMLNTERATRGSSRTFVRYHDLLDAWQPAVRAIHRDLGLGELAADDPRFEAIDSFVDPGLRRIALTWDDLELPDRLATLARDTWNCLDRLPDGHDSDPAVLAELDAIHEAYNAYYLEAEVVSRSTLIAARRSAAKKNANRQQPVTIGGREAARALGLATARRFPKPLRRMVPGSMRSRLVSPSAPRALPPGPTPGA